MKQDLKRIAFHTLGCKLNYAETSTIARDFKQKNYEIVTFSDPADVYVLNTCTVTGNAERKCRKLIRQVRKRAPGAYVAVVGCYAELRAEEIAAIPGVDLVLGSADKFDLISRLAEHPKNGAPVILTSSGQDHLDYHASWSVGTRTRSFLKIQDGCDYNCSYCTIPMARGQSRNGSIAEVVAAAQVIIGQGSNEIVLTGVNIGDFGKSTGESLVDLLRSLESVEGLNRLRLSSIEPNLLTDEILELMTSSPKFCPHFHLPLQSGSDRILRLMKRRYPRDLYARRVNKIRRLLPDAFIAADVIVGFPGETDEDFHETVDFIKGLEISALHVFTYSERPGTSALALTGAVSTAERERRSRKLHELSVLKKQAFYDRAVGQTRTVLFESGSHGLLTGFTDNYIQVQVPGRGDLCNTLAEVKLTGRVEDILKGEMVQ
ncbi:MAG: tRNA (N(6)-L-threonylcarbamoyladenosine(37)-C(2))-methylthiotransferase MtaB [FCB group bacterium]|nr:tRNA (N(6)-L-threonylcarbamoyladenosine(37)-C(2))-methylthiotransferase MtaB [FCB group bacterium]